MSSTKLERIPVFAPETTTMFDLDVTPRQPAVDVNDPTWGHGGAERDPDHDRRPPRGAACGAARTARSGTDRADGGARRPQGRARARGPARRSGALDRLTGVLRAARAWGASL